MIAIEPAEYMTPTEVAEKLAVSTNTLKNWRNEGHFVEPVQIAPRTIRYRREAVERWLREHDPTRGES